jgi:predicted porin
MTLAVRGELVPRFSWGTYVKRTFIAAAAILALTASGHADELSEIQAQAKQLREQNQAMQKRLADLEKRQKALEQKPVAVNPVDSMAADLPYKAVKAAPVESDDICWHGVCVYGNFDMGVDWIQHSSPFNAMVGGPLLYVVGSNSQLPSYAGVAVNQMSTSFIGLRGKQEIGDNLYAVFNLQTLFNPASGMNANGIGSLVQNNGFNQAPQLGLLANAYGDSSKSGQMFNNVAYFGVSSPVWGTFTMGRQSALTSDLVVNYDALSGSNAWSLIVFEGATGGGGVTENRIYDNAYEYRLNVGPVRFAAEVQAPNGGNSATGLAYQGDVGFDYVGLSMDFVGGHEKDAISSSPLSTAQVNQLTANQLGSATTGTGAAISPLGYAIPCSLGCLSAVVSDNTVFAVGAKYTLGPWKFYGGYEHITFKDPSTPLLPGAFAQGGYNVGFLNNNRYLTDRNQNVFWAGVKYAVTPTFDVIGAYYGARQGFFFAGAGAGAGGNNTFVSFPGGPANAPGLAGQATNCAIASASSPGCSGTIDMFSLALDWRFARHVDLYAGVAYSTKSGGLANAFVLSTLNGALAGNNVINRVSSWDPGIGLRYQF